jgi:RNA polymerase sigma-70 factor (ECF subfamily)
MRKEKQQELLKLIAENERIVYKVSNTYCSDKNDRQDLAQEIIYNLLKSYHSFDDQYKFSTWMYRVALNVAISFYRKNKTGKKLKVLKRIFKLKNTLISFIYFDERIFFEVLA